MIVLPVNFYAHIHCHFLELSQPATQVGKCIILLCSLGPKKEEKKLMFNCDEELLEKNVETIVFGSIGHTLHS
jgi:hypothetical protein